TSRRCSGAGKRCSKRAERRLRDRVEDKNALVRAGLSEGGELAPECVRRDWRRLGLRAPLAGAAVDFDQQAGAAPHLDRIPAAALAGLVDPAVEHGESL